MLYYNPVQIYFDVHIDDMLKTLPPCVLVTSKGFVKRGVVENIKRIMQKKIAWYYRYHCSKSRI